MEFGLHGVEYGRDNVQTSPCMPAEFFENILHALFIRISAELLLFRGSVMLQYRYESAPVRDESNTKNDESDDTASN